MKPRHSTPKVHHLKPIGGAGRTTEAHVAAYLKAGVGQEAVVWPVGDGVQRALKWLASGRPEPKRRSRLPKARK
jgi:hypothetical protein